MMDNTCCFEYFDVMLNAVNTHITEISHNFNAKFWLLLNYGKQLFFGVSLGFLRFFPL